MRDKISVIIRSSMLLFLYFSSIAFQYLPFIIFHADINQYQGNTRLAVYLSLFSDFIILFIILCMYKNDIQREFSIFLKKIRTNLDTGFACWIAGLIIMFLSNSILTTVFHAEGANNEIVVRSLIHALPILMGINVCLMAPFIEEFVFRKTLKDVFSNPIVFVLLSFLFFGTAHVYGMAKTWIDWLYVIPYGALGGAFALAYYKTDTIFTSMFFHMFHNLFVLILILLAL
ncbi:MAG: CPBP family intramembrane metalloprotease [Bacilli bacterium]|nr:CPBP family intramembrane metalloprotease [Bacilli bacterium]